jgi:gas vesicle protein
MIGKSTIWLTFLAGAATGAVAGLLFAPEKGQKTREVILKRAIALRKELEKSFESNDFSYFTKYRKTA